MTSVAVLGSTGSIGVQTLEVIDAAAEEFEVVALGAHASVEALAAQAQRYRPAVVGLADDTRAKELRSLLPAGTELEAGPGALASLSGLGDVAVNGVVGFAGLPVTIGALESGRRLALA
ncbi:MAG: 1-deoxy-D-xylulose-5-phosphate reductoisomerase, partial [Actinomycetes bacterium]